MNQDASIRLAAFEHLEMLTRGRKVVPTRELGDGFVWQGDRVHLLTQAKGIFKPAQMRSVLSIKTIAPRGNRLRPYDDAVLDDGLFEYRFRGTDPLAHDNQLLRQAWQDQIPLIYFKAVEPAVYEVLWPVFIREWDSARLICFVQSAGALAGAEWSARTENIEKRYEIRQTRQRLHQGAFRAMVLGAYARKCAICGLPMPEMLEAAHILEDGQPDSRPAIDNGICLCILHHRAYDRCLIGIDRDLRLHLNRRVIAVSDGPVFQHGLLNLAERGLEPPPSRDDWPNPELLARRFEQFLVN